MTGRGVGVGGALRWFALLVIGMLFVLVLPGSSLAQEQQVGKLEPLQVIVLVDQSGSISEPDMQREKDAAKTIVFSALASGSEVSVAGFASSVTADKTGAVDVVCDRIVLDGGQTRDQLSKCLEGLSKRAPGEGEHTDHATALRQALGYARSGGPKKKIVFLLTDGKLDVSGSESWGEPPQRRNEIAAADARKALDELADAGAQVWPLGFGAVDPRALAGFARGTSCTAAAPDPQSRVVPTAVDLVAAVKTAYTSASCVKYGEDDVGTVPRGGTLDLHVEIPAVASDASILVYKRDARVQVEYFAPGSDVAAPAAGGSEFEFAGQSSAFESLRIAEPTPGEWTVRLSSAEVAAEDVTATVVYQAAVRTYLTVTPPTAAPGDTVEVNMNVWARGRVVADEVALAGLTFVTTMTGDGIEPQRVELTGPREGGTFAGQLTIPSDADGAIVYTGEVTGIGIGGDTRTLLTSVAPGSAAVQARVLYSGGAAAHPGGEVSGTVSVTNRSAGPARLRLRLDDLTPGTALTVDPPVIDAAPGSSEVPFTLTFGADTALGATGGILRVVDDSDPAVVVGERLLSIQVDTVPTVFERFFWMWLALAAIVVVVALYLAVKVRARVDAARVRGLRVELWRDDLLVSEVTPRRPRSRYFGFTVHQDFTGPHLQSAGSDESGAYRISRAGTGLRLSAPGQHPTPISPGDRRSIGDGLAVAVVDERATGAGHAGPPVDPFAAAVAAPVDLFATGGATTAFPSSSQVTTTPPYEHSREQPTEHLGRPVSDSYLDPNNPFG